MPARPAGCRLLGRLAAAMQTEQTASGIEEMEHRVDEAAQFARGLHEALLPAVSECDQSMRGVAISQRVLNTQLDKLSEELAKFSEHLPLPSLMPHAAKLQRTKQAIASVNVTLARVHARLENIRDLVRSRVDGATPVMVRPTVASAEAPRGADPPPSAATSASAHVANSADAAGVSDSSAAPAASASSVANATQPAAAAAAASADSPQLAQAAPVSHVTSVAELLSWAT